MDVRGELRAVVAELVPVWDILLGRVVDSGPPAWCEARGWSGFLLALDDEELRAAEHLGLLAVSGLPPDLEALTRRVRALVFPLRGEATAAQAVESRRVPARKRSQVASLLSLVRRHCCGVSRVVELGAGHGHLTRVLARGLGVPALGVDRDSDRVHTARELAAGVGAEFRWADGEDDDVDIAKGELLVGLHACGSLGDILVRRAIAGGAHGLLVSCCLQKIGGGSRQPLSCSAGGLVLPKPMLGLTNLTAWDDPARIETVMRGRQTRHALRLLLAGRGVSVDAGEEARGINRRRFRLGLSEVARDACARRGLLPPSDDEIRRCGNKAALEHARIRRLSLPRTMLGRLVEYAVVLDRAAAFAEAGYAVRVQPLFSSDVSPRNLGVLATAR